eukprot:TRINITY_DN8454_c0_g3_i2.p1 TRINITY_DN8454_c0_g3~~TRINITY_DN8454_c0_g3_i2.p1  ORF type:complete len:183 (+),score=21.76 TRINITY_DN8454_c0_g3_i2:29-550(+)
MHSNTANLPEKPLSSTANTKEKELASAQTHKEKSNAFILPLTSVRSTIVPISEEQKVAAVNKSSLELQEVSLKIVNNNSEQRILEGPNLKEEPGKDLEVPNNYCITCKLVQVIFEVKFSRSVASTVKYATSAWRPLTTTVYGWERALARATRGFSLCMCCSSLSIAWCQCRTC